MPWPTAKCLPTRYSRNRRPPRQDGGASALRWLVQQQDVIVLSKTATEARLKENFAIFDFALTREEMAAVRELARPDGRIVNPQGLAPEWDA